jgi:glycosyltransferase involved in cell wall biosynthesis
MTTTLSKTTEGERYRVLVICNDGDYFLRHRLSVVTRLTSIGVNVTVIAGGNPIPIERTQGWKYIHVGIKRFGFNPISDAALMVRTARAVWRLKPDAVHLITLKPTVFSGFVSLVSRFFHGHPKRILITLPGLGRMMSQPKGPGEPNYRIEATLTLLAFRILAQHDHVHFTFETKHDRDFWEKRHIVTNRTSSIIDGAGVDPNRFYPVESPRSKSTRKVIFASRLLKSKGLNAFLTMARELAHRPDVQFIVAGMSDADDPDGVQVEYLKGLDEINFVGHVEAMPDLLRECDIVCLPTWYGEGMPRILIEAAATGLASIVSDHPGCREVVENGVTGQILMATSDIEMSRKLSAAVVKYLQDPELLNEHKQAAYRRFLLREFNQNAVDARFVELLGANFRSVRNDETLGARAR